MLKNVLLAYQMEFTEENSAAFASPLYHISKQTDFSFYHYKASCNQSIQSSGEIENIDKRFAFSYCDSQKQFASDAKLFRGCVRLNKKEVHLNNY